MNTAKRELANGVIQRDKTRMLTLVNAPSEQHQTTTDVPVKRTRASRAISNAYREALEAQKLLMADIRNEDTTPTQRAACVRAWTELEERKRILKGLPLPGQYRPEKPSATKSAIG